ncbi:hypothetical protein [Thomasclavelia sp.]|uniref:hypothetical protein n=1 Tax=Thomasclavelia sp. TaxID=3025757 RepID=UPI0025DC6366|nr:hypothetical protein [Thomasclavelia sp.]
MLKLLKYEIIESYRQYLLTFLVFLLLCVVTPLMPITTITGILSVLTSVCFFGIIIAMFLNVIISFNRSMYKRPGYLTLTLPVSSEKLIGAKLIGSLIWISASMLVLLVGITILLFTTGEVRMANFFEALIIVVKRTFSNFDVFLIYLVDYLAFMSAIILSFYLVITFTKTKFIPKYKTFVGIAIYFISWIVIFSFLERLPIVYSNEISSICLGVCLSLIFFVATVYLINHQIEVE